MLVIAPSVGEMFVFRCDNTNCKKVAVKYTKMASWFHFVISIKHLPNDYHNYFLVKFKCLRMLLTLLRSIHKEKEQYSSSTIEDN